MYATTLSTRRRSPSRLRSWNSSKISNPTLGAAAQSAQSTDEITSSLSDAQDAVNEASQTISDIDAPADLEDENADLVAALDGFEQALADAQAAVESGDAQAVNQLVSKAQAFAGKIGQIQQRLVDAGVELNPGGG